MFEYQHKIRIRYAETDQMGYAYYGNYSAYYEVARAEALRSLGFTYKQLEEQGVMMPVYENYSKYYRPAKYDDLITIKVLVKQKPATKMLFDYEIYNESNTLIHIGATTLVFVDKQTARPCGVPAIMEEIFKPFF